MKYIAVKNFERFQHYRDRVPPWIKLYNTLLDDYAFLQLSDASRSHLILLWLVASRHKNRIPYDPKYIAGALHARGRVDLAGLIGAGFLAVVEEDASKDASTPLAECSESAKAEREGEKERETEQAHTTQATGAIAEEALRAAMGQRFDAVLTFLASRPPRTHGNWYAELLRVIGPATGVLPEDLATACSDALLVDPPLSSPHALRTFAEKCRDVRIRPAPAILRISSGRGAPNTAAVDDQAWSDALDVVARMTRRELDASAFAELPAPLRAGLRSIGGWTMVRDATARDLPFKRRDFLAAYHAAARTAEVA